MSDRKRPVSVDLDDLIDLIKYADECSYSDKGEALVQRMKALVEKARPKCPEEFHLVYKHSTESERCTLKEDHTGMHESESFRWEEKA